MPESNRRTCPIIGAALAVLAILVTGCPAAYRPLAQEGPNSSAVVRSPVFFVAPLTFSFQQPGWESQEEWTSHTSAWAKYYWDEIASRGNTLSGKRLEFAPPSAAGAQGVFVLADVVGLRRGWNVGGGYDFVVANVEFLDVATRQRLLTVQVESSSHRMGPEGWTFGGRIKFACENLGEAVVELMRGGRL